MPGHKGQSLLGFEPWDITEIKGADELYGADGIIAQDVYKRQAHTDGKFGLSDKGAMEIMKLFFTPNEQLQDKKITDFFDDEVLNSNFWLYWRTMFAFENWHSALEMKLYLKRYIHHIAVSYTHLSCRVHRQRCR